MKFKHGYAPYSGERIPEYAIWKTMRQRCENPNSHKYENYGARGIKVCERWNNFELFLEDMGRRPSKKHSIDRKDVNGNYDPSNCHWASTTEQARNRTMQKNNKSGQNGVHWDKESERWRSCIRISRKLINLGRFIHLEDAIKARKEAEEKYNWKSS